MRVSGPSVTPSTGGDPPIGPTSPSTVRHGRQGMGESPVCHRVVKGPYPLVPESLMYQYYEWTGMTDRVRFWVHGRGTTVSGRTSGSQHLLVAPAVTSVLSSPSRADPGPHTVPTGRPEGVRRRREGGTRSTSHRRLLHRSRTVPGELRPDSGLRNQNWGVSRSPPGSQTPDGTSLRFGYGWWSPCPLRVDGFLFRSGGGLWVSTHWSGVTVGTTVV